MQHVASYSFMREDVEFILEYRTNARFTVLEENNDAPLLVDARARARRGINKKIDRP